MDAQKPNHALQRQMMLMVLAAVFLGCFVLSIVAGNAARRALVDQAERDAGAMLRQVIRNIQYYLDDMESLADLSSAQSATLRMLVNDAPIENNQSAYYENAIAARSMLTDLSKIRPEITSIAIAGQNGAFVDTSNPLFTTAQAEEGSLSWYDLAIESGRRSVYLPPYAHTDGYGRTLHVISLLRPIAMPRLARPIGAMRINLNTDVLADICSGAQIGDQGYIFIVDSGGNVIYRPDGADPSAIIGRTLGGESSFLLDGQLVLCDFLDSAGYYVAAVLPYGLIVADAERAQWTHVMLGAAIAVGIAALVAALLSRKVFAPLNALRALMGRVQTGDFDVRADGSRSDEIGELAGGFNTMLQHSQALMAQNIAIEQQKRRAELAALQSQITPHFLYNALDSIIWMANYKPQVAANMAAALARLFRLMLGGGEDIVPLGQEFEHVTQYLIIQKMRYTSKFDYEVELDPAYAAIRVPKLILQPLVENAIYHGIKPASRVCQLRVKAILDGDELVLLVMDDGVGMSEEAYRKVLSGEIVPEKPLSGIGVKNIAERIHMYFPGAPGLSFLGMVGVGTVAMIRIPANGV